jgi:heme-degrading monooxygenase HmoA
VGYLSHEVQRCIEEPSRYVLLVKWESVEAHELNFRQTDLFPQWRGLIGVYFAQPPHVVHCESVPLT